MADIPLALDSGGESLLQAGMPTTIGLAVDGWPKAAPASPTWPRASTSWRVQTPVWASRHKPSLASMSCNSPLTVQTIMLGTDFNSHVFLVITGGAGNQAIVIDIHGLPSRTSQVDNLELIAIVGAVRALGSAGQKVACGDASVQRIALNPGNEII